ncbi:hypothetical protein HanXRQr2_Chr17g0810781 [Helianthus annuus]|uniref:Uncharacterized protein n=1 Tax=Helianthus annuus TaxID=4232 RepID=A0A9K3DIH8_HELAN|nr:hypothetical protein HanXRQr2_Chr17g0810781 [Helianthus annuus]
MILQLRSFYFSSSSILVQMLTLHKHKSLVIYLSSKHNKTNNVIQMNHSPS